MSIGFEMASANIASALLQEWISAIESNDVDRITNLYRTDASVIGFAVAGNIRGRSAIYDLYDDMISDGKTKKIILLSQNPHIFGTVAVNFGHYREQHEEGEDGLHRNDITAYFSFVYREDDDGVWKIFSQHYSLVNFILNEFSAEELREMLDKKEKENYSQDMR